MKGWIFIAVGTVVGVGTLVAIFGPSYRSTEPPLEYYLDMKVQPRYRGQSQSKFFADGRAMRLPVPGTVAYGGADYLGSAGAPRLNLDLLKADDSLYRGKSGDKWLMDCRSSSTPPCSTGARIASTFTAPSATAAPAQATASRHSMASSGSRTSFRRSIEACRSAKSSTPSPTEKG